MISGAVSVEAAPRPSPGSRTALRMDELPAALAVTPTDPTNVDTAELSAEKLTVRFQGLAAISDVSLTVRRHEIFGLIGPNGAAKRRW